MKKRQREERKEKLKDWMAGKRTWNKEHPAEAMEKRLQNLLDREVRLKNLWQREEVRHERKEIKRRLRLERKALKEAKKKVIEKPKRGFFRWLKDRYDHLIKTKLKAGR
jgi:phosphoribosylformylglycinamidine (FGAM) synthase-like enzyme